MLMLSWTRTRCVSSYLARCSGVVGCEAAVFLMSWLCWWCWQNFTNVPSDDYRDVIARIITDGFFRCPSERFASAIRAHGSSAYVYTFNHPNFSGRHLFDLFGVPTQCYNKTCHMVELPFVFHFLSYPSMNYQYVPPGMLQSIDACARGVLCASWLVV